ncbi:hypothetical protein GJ496_003973 [Pomphorhynchus laevis]|nr:hypothetical protein GJ496_002326 [Pomphorhynchus laevis]KAI0988201.1 hypothetical protein GJ496_003973 [Pomphorhynchus laevis]
MCLKILNLLIFISLLLVSTDTNQLCTKIPNSLTIWLHKNVTLKLYSTDEVIIRSDDLNVVKLLRRDLILNQQSPVTNEYIIKGLRLGRAELSISSPQNETICPSIKVSVVPKRQIVDRIFDYATIIIVLMSSFIMGALIEFEKCRQCLSTKTGLKAAIGGLFMHWLLLPPLSLGISKLFRYNQLQTIALFAVACAPMGTKSQQWTVIFDGDVNLSVVLTFLSTLFSFITMPLWLMTLVRMHLKVNVPFKGLVRTLACVVLPYVVSMALTKWKPSLRDITRRYVKSILIIILIFFITVGIYVSWPLFTQLHWSHFISAPSMQWAACIFGLMVSTFILQLKWQQALTFALSVGYQNIGVAFLLVRYNFPQPESDISSTIILIIAAMGSIPLWLAFLIKKIYQLVSTKRKQPITKATTDLLAAKHVVEDIERKLLQTG